MPRTKQPAEHAYEQYERQLMSRVWGWTHKTGRNFSDLLGVAHEGFMYAVQTYDPGKGRFGTHLYTVVNQHLARFCRTVDEAVPLPEDWHEVNTTNLTPAEVVAFMDELEGLGAEARYVVGLVLQGGFLGGTPAIRAQAIRGRIVQHLRDQGWPWKTIGATFREIREVLA